MNGELTPEIIEFFKNNAWPLVFDTLFENPAFIGVMAALAFAITCWGVSKLVSLTLKIDFGVEKRAFNDGFLSGYKHAMETLSQDTHVKRTEEEQ